MIPNLSFINQMMMFYILMTDT